MSSELYYIEQNLAKHGLKDQSVACSIKIANTRYTLGYSEVTLVNVSLASICATPGVLARLLTGNQSARFVYSTIITLLGSGELGTVDRNGTFVYEFAETLCESFYWWLATSSVGRRRVFENEFDPFLNAAGVLADRTLGYYGENTETLLAMSNMSDVIDLDTPRQLLPPQVNACLDNETFGNLLQVAVRETRSLY